MKKVHVIKNMYMYDLSYSFLFHWPDTYLRSECSNWYSTISNRGEIVERVAQSNFNG